MKRLDSFGTSLLLLLACVLFLPRSVHAQGESFYAGKNIRLVVGYGAATATDLWARLIARHISKYIPGSPTMVVQNMPGATSLIAANQIYAMAKPDGLTLGVIAPALYFDQLVGRKEVQFDWAKFGYIGSPTRTNEIFFARTDAPFKSIEDIRKASVPPKCGATGTASTGYYVPMLMEQTLGTKFNIVTGYQGGNDIDLAIERGEVQCRGFSLNSFFAREPFTSWRKRGFVRVLIQTGKDKDPRLRDVPTIYELMNQYKTPDSGQRLATVVLAAGDIGRPFVAPPAVSPDILKILRQAFAKVVADPEVKAAAEKQELELDPTEGEALETIAKEVVTQPPDVIESMKKLLRR
jgi:tripartite-type tricarboxylate transporter receptor subunit TctC